MKEVFLSHVHEDKALAGKVKEILEANGVSAFLAHMDMEVSEEWRTEIFRHLETSSALIAIVTEFCQISLGKRRSWNCLREEITADSVDVRRKCGSEGCDRNASGNPCFRK